MANFVIILAGGIGSRMNSTIPKQFILVKGKPIIVYTIENFEKNPKIDGILVVCENSWIKYLQELIKEYDLTKVKWIVPGGKTGHDSTSNGLFFLKQRIKLEDYVIIHDAARPILPQLAIDNMIDVAYKNGNASLAIPCYETIIYTDNHIFGNKDLDRNTLMRVQTPQMYKYEFILKWYEQAFKEGLHNFVYADLVGIYYGENIYFSKGFTNNLKITKSEDLSLFEFLIDRPEDTIYG